MLLLSGQELYTQPLSRLHHSFRPADTDRLRETSSSVECCFSAAKDKSEHVDTYAVKLTRVALYIRLRVCCDLFLYADPAQCTDHVCILYLREDHECMQYLGDILYTKISIHTQCVLPNICCVPYVIYQQHCQRQLR